MSVLVGVTIALLIIKIIGNLPRWVDFRVLCAQWPGAKGSTAWVAFATPFYKICLIFFNKLAFFTFSYFNNIDLTTPNIFICKILVEIDKIKNYYLLKKIYSTYFDTFSL
jgi:hypothetical protein